MLGSLNIFCGVQIREACKAREMQQQSEAFLHPSMPHSVITEEHFKGSRMKDIVVHRSTLMLVFFIFIPQSPFISLSCLHVIESSLTNNNLSTSCPFSLLLLSSLSLFMSSVSLCADNQDITTSVICPNTLYMLPTVHKYSHPVPMEPPLQDKRIR